MIAVQQDETHWCVPCGWARVMPPIPRGLILTPEERRAGWEGFKITDQFGGGFVDAKLAHDRALRAELEATKKVTAAERREKWLNNEHAGEIYDRKKRRWVKVTVEVTDDAEAEAEEVFYYERGQ